ncbi:hypothetical protein AN237_24865 (plasmid) [Raoultella ornithinolytica]|nr:hypothetical protein AN237_24865 [Raoultella ornithinolytica]
MPGAGNRERPQQGKCLLWSTPVAASRGAYHSRENVYCGRRRWRRPGELTTAVKMSTVVDAGGGVPGSVPQPGKCLLWSTPVAASRGAYHSRENVYCGRRRWRRPGERSTAGKISTVADAGTALRQLAAVGEMSTVVDAGTAFRQLAEVGEMSTVVDAGTALRQLVAVGEMSTVVDAGRALRQLAAVGEMSTVVDAGRALRQLVAVGETSTVDDAGGGAPSDGRSMGKCLLWSMPVAASRQLAAVRGNVYCGRCRRRRPGSWPQ